MAQWTGVMDRIHYHYKWSNDKGSSWTVDVHV